MAVNVAVAVAVMELEPRIPCCHPQDRKESMAVKVAILPRRSKSRSIYKYKFLCRLPGKTLSLAGVPKQILNLTQTDWLYHLPQHPFYGGGKDLHLGSKPMDTKFCVPQCVARALPSVASDVPTCLRLDVLHPAAAARARSGVSAGVFSYLLEVVQQLDVTSSGEWLRSLVQYGCVLFN